MGSAKVWLQTVYAIWVAATVESAEVCGRGNSGIRIRRTAMRRDWLRTIVLATMLSIAAVSVMRAQACGGYGGLTMEVLRALADYPDKPLPVEKLREQGPEALDELMRLRGLMQRQLAELLKQPSSPEQTAAVQQIERRQ